METPSSSPPKKQPSSNAYAALRGPPSPLRLARLSIAAGILAYLLSAAATVAVLMITRMQPGSGRPPPGPVPIMQNPVVPGTQVRSVRTLDNPLIPMLVGPILETFLFLMAYKFLEKVGGRFFALLPFTIMLSVLGWALHGAGRFDVGPALGFAVLAFVFFRTAERHGPLWAFLAAALAHVVWNSVAIGLSLIRN